MSRAFKYFFVVLVIVVGVVAFYLNSKIELKSYLQISNIKKRAKINGVDRFILDLFKDRINGDWVYFGKKEIKRLDFFKILLTNKNRFKKITLIPGETTYIFFKSLEKKLGFDFNKLWDIYNKEAIYKEGSIIADTYFIFDRDDEEKALKKMLDYSLNIFKKIAKKEFGEWDKDKFKRILIVASIVEKEAANEKEMPLVASVIYNRLKKKMRLQMDGTLNYGKYSHIKVTPQRIRNDKSFYNTYKFRGLPKEPVCNVSIEAIRAAINPAKSDFLYFVRNNKGSHTFSKDYKKHLKNIKRRKEYLKKISK